MRSNDLPQRELAEACGVTLRTVARWAADGRLPRDANGRVIRAEAERTFVPHVIVSRLRETLGQLSPASTAAVLIEVLGASYIGALANVLNGSNTLPEADCDLRDVVA